ncbi:MAG: Ribose operon repressor [Candidatus Carbobacillus altaicus]|uniref:Ribose operon repressor n=1 Tax=Candidatus Carbonibacillus altaicus TaxID=2163959 RepID=A0A2R6Y2H9_9BACL|nr:MAG: Ribose operon repressor [Candidatus Carbobacillus altaicus]
MPTIRDVARLAGVSVATVSRYLNNSGYISQEAAQKIRHAIEALDYEPNVIARGLAKKRTSTIAVLLPDITNPFFAELVKSVEASARDRDYNVVIWSIDEGETAEHSFNAFLRMLQLQYIEGVVISTHTLTTKQVEALKKLAIPFVFLDRPALVTPAPVIRADNRKGARLAVRHLREVGATQIAHIGGPQALLPARERLQGYLEEIKEGGLDMQPMIVEGDFTLEGGMNAIYRILEQAPDTDGIFAANDLMAIGALKALHRAGIAVPEDISIIGFDGISLTAMIEPELSTIAQPIAALGARAVDRLIHLAEHGGMDEHVDTLEVTLIARASTQRGRLH